ncbi:restriction endonuclease subunit S [Corynebacterium flavescens]|uniref:restriction endonuclease subunit S n=1 Tax=Corynebacterium flavescens TaxID=28028 RepID=UPI003FD522FE
MSHLNELIEVLCPHGVDYIPMWQITTWDKKFNAVDRAKQPEVRKYEYLLASEIKDLNVNGGDVKLLTTNESDLWTTQLVADRTIYDAEIIAIPWGGNAIVQHYNGKFITSDNRIAIARNPKVLDMKFLYYFISNHLDVLATFYRGSGIKHPNMAKVLDWPIPVPPIEVQQEIVRILDNFTALEAELEAELEARKSQYDYYLKELLSFNPGEMSWKTLGEIGNVSMCKRIFKAQTSPEGDIPFFKIGTFGGEADAFIPREIYEQYKETYNFPNRGDVLISAAGTIGRAIKYDGKPAYFQDSNIVWINNDESIVINDYLFYWYRVVKWATDGGTIRRLYNSNIRKAKIAVPPIARQREIVNILDKFDALVNNLSSGLPAEIAARRKQYEYYRDQLLTFKELAS